MIIRHVFALGLMFFLAGSVLSQSQEIVPVDAVPEEGDVIEEVPFVDYSTTQSSRLWFTADYLVGWMQSRRLPVLVTTSTSSDRGTAGILGLPETSILFGGQHINDEARSGLRFGAGYWIDAQRIFGVHAGLFILESQSAIFAAASQGSPILARPFTNALTGDEDAALVAFPGVVTGSMDVSATSRNLFGGHLAVSEQILERGGFRLDSLLGYRFLRYDERLLIQDTRFPLEAAFTPGTRIFTRDDFGTQNEFHGGEIGLRAEYCGSPWSLEVIAKVAVGNLGREVNIDGSTVVSVPGETPSVRSGGLLALSSNIGSIKSNDWVAIPEVGLSAGWEVSSQLRLRLGYTFLSLGEIARAAEQVDTEVNTNLIPPSTSTAGPPSPARTFFNSNMWVQMINFGLEYRY
jgi:hypothetical protein